MAFVFNQCCNLLFGSIFTWPAVCVRVLAGSRAAQALSRAGGNSALPFRKHPRPSEWRPVGHLPYRARRAAGAHRAGAAVVPDDVRALDRGEPAIGLERQARSVLGAGIELGGPRLRRQRFLQEHPPQEFLHPLGIVGKAVADVGGKP